MLHVVLVDLAPEGVLYCEVEEGDFDGALETLSLLDVGSLLPSDLSCLLVDLDCECCGEIVADLTVWGIFLDAFPDCFELFLA